MEGTGNIVIDNSDTAEEIKNKLETLTGEDRLDASAIKNLPSGSASALKMVEVTASRDLTSDDLGAVLYSNATTDIELTIPTGLGDTSAFTFMALDTGKVQVKNGTGVTFTPVETTGVRLPFSVVSISTDSYISFAADRAIEYTPTEPLPQDYYSNLDAANNQNETNAAPNFTSVQGALSVTSVVSDDTVNGDAYALKLIAGVDGDNTVRVPTSVVSGETYTIIVRTNRKSGFTNAWKCSLLTTWGWSSNSFNTLTTTNTGEWYETVITGQTANANNASLVIGCSSSGVIGWEADISTIIINKE